MDLHVGRMTTPSEHNAQNIAKPTDTCSTQETQVKVKQVRFCEYRNGCERLSRLCNWARHCSPARNFRLLFFGFSFGVRRLRRHSSKNTDPTKFGTVPENTLRPRDNGKTCKDSGQYKNPGYHFDQMGIISSTCFKTLWFPRSSHCQLQTVPPRGPRVDALAWCRVSRHDCGLGQLKLKVRPAACWASARVCAHTCCVEDFDALARCRPQGNVQLGR